MWIKKGMIYAANGFYGFDVSHCHKPTPLILENGNTRVFFGVRDADRKTRTTYVDLNSENLGEVLHVHDQPVIVIEW